jgi:hypothetical protein
MPFGSALGMRTEAMSLSLLSLVHVAPACTWSGQEKDLTTLGIMYTTVPYISTRGCFQDLNPLPHGHKASFTAAPGSLRTEAE